MANEGILGIDLGTTITVCFAWVDGQAVPIHIDGEVKLPSVVCLRDIRHPIVGERARTEQGLFPNSTIVQAKRLIGQRMDSPELKHDLAKWQFEVVPDLINGNPRIKIGDELFAPEEVESFILKKVKASAQNKLGVEIVKAVITVPAHFNDNQKQATRNAAQLAGFDQVRIMTEPVAAALAHDISLYDQKKEILVFDLGGGTFDVSVLSLQKTDNGPIFFVKSIHGDSHLGGEDFDNNMVEYISKKYLSDIKWGKGKKGKEAEDDFLVQLRQKCEKTKRALGTEESTSMVLSRVGKDSETKEITIARQEFVDMNQELFDRALALVEKVKNISEKNGTPIGAILATGGSSQIPYLRTQLAELVNQALMKTTDNPDTAVATGACRFAASLWRPYEPNAPNLILIETCPYNIGIAVKGKEMDVFFKKDSTIPQSKKFSYTTLYDRQRFAQVSVYEGNADDVSENHKLGTFTLEIDPLPAGVPKIDVTVAIDLDGILTVTAMDKANKSSMEIRACKTTLSTNEVLYRKAKSDFNECKDEYDDAVNEISKKVTAIGSLSSPVAKSIDTWAEEKNHDLLLKALTKKNASLPSELELVIPKVESLIDLETKLEHIREKIQEHESRGPESNESASYYHTIFIVDRSYSMRKKDSKTLNGEVASRYSSVFGCINKYLSDRSFSDDIFSMLLFNNRVRQGFKRLRYSSNLERRIDKIQKTYPPHSTTSFQAAAEKIQGLINNSMENTVIIFLSDGHDPEYETACDTLRDIVASNKYKTPSFYAIRFGKSKVAAGSLEKLAEVAGGSFSTARDGIALNETFGEIQRAAEQSFNVWQDTGTTIVDSDARSGFYSVKDLMKKLLIKGSADKEFVKCFFMVYRSFISPSELLVSFSEAYQLSKEDAKPPLGSSFASWSRNVKVHIRLQFKAWVAEYAEDFKFIKTDVEKFLDSWRLPDAKKEILDLIDLGSRVSRGVVAPRKDDEAKPKEFISYSPREIAQEITLIQMKLYNSIKGYEFLDGAWTTTKNRNNTVLKMLKLTEKLSWWTANTILNEDDLKPRTKMISHFINIAVELMKLRNFYAAVAVIGGLGTEPVARLNQTKDGISKKSKTAYVKIYTAIRENKTNESSEKKACVPWFDTYLSKIVAIEQDVQERSGGKLLNWEKKESLYALITDILKHKEANEEKLKKWKENHALQKIFQNFSHKTKKDLLVASKRLES